MTRFLRNPMGILHHPWGMLWGSPRGPPGMSRGSLGIPKGCPRDSPGVLPGSIGQSPRGSWGNLWRIPGVFMLDAQTSSRHPPRHPRGYTGNPLKNLAPFGEPLPKITGEALSQRQNPRGSLADPWGISRASTSGPQGTNGASMRDAQENPCKGSPSNPWGIARESQGIPRGSPHELCHQTVSTPPVKHCII